MREPAKDVSPEDGTPLDRSRPTGARDDLTHLLNQLGRGRPEEVEAWMPRIVDELRAVAQGQMRHEGGHTLQPTALVHETFLRIFGTPGRGWKDRKHFFALASKAMRQILVDHARARKRIKRGAGRVRVTFDAHVAASQADAPDVLELHEALAELSTHDELQARVVELRFFGGLSVEEVGEVLELSKSTIEREWRAARAWLGIRLEGAEA